MVKETRQFSEDSASSTVLPTFRPSLPADGSPGGALGCRGPAKERLLRATPLEACPLSDLCPMSASSEAGSDPRDHLRVTWGMCLWAGKPPLGYEL